MAVFWTEPISITKNCSNVCYRISGKEKLHKVLPRFVQWKEVIFLKEYKFIYFNWWLITLCYCIGFAIHQHESATGIYVFPILNPPPSSFPVLSLWVVSVHQPQASNIMHRTLTGDSFHIWCYTCFNAILPNHPTLSLSHRVWKKLKTYM